VLSRQAIIVGEAESELERVDLRGAELTDLNLPRCASRTPILTEPYSGRAKLSNATLLETTLRNTNLSNADLRDVDLTRARLDGAILRGTDLSNAKLRVPILPG